VCISQGHEVPEPSSSVTYSGRIVLRLPRSIHRQAARLAERDQTSLNTYLVSAVAAKVGAEDFYNVLANRFAEHVRWSAYRGFLDAQQFTGANQKIGPLKVEKTASMAGTRPQLTGVRR
jgi:hypothetical protein